MNLNKSLEFFNPIDKKLTCHVIGCGAIGSNIADLLVRLGIDDIHIYDFDTIGPHNIANQRYYSSQIKQPKTMALNKMLKDINPLCNVTVHDKGWTEKDKLYGYVFLAVDSIELRAQIVKLNKYNPMIIAMYDYRIRLSDAQHYAAVWNDKDEVDDLLNSMAFTSKEAKEQTPVSACGTSLSVMPTVSMICAAGIANFINYVKNKNQKKIILIDAFDFEIDALPLS